jgi:DNA-binding MarR family transcriptional regulator
MPTVMAKISGETVKRRILRRMRASTQDPRDTDSAVLTSPESQRVLGVIAMSKPQSIHELAQRAGQVEGGLSRTLSALASAGFVTMEDDERATVPTLTPKGRQKFEELGLSSDTPKDIVRESPTAGIFSASWAVGQPSDLSEGKVDGELVIRLWDQSTRETVELREQAELVAFSMRVLDNWWRILCRRDDPFDLLEANVGSTSGEGRAKLLARALGGSIEVTAETGYIIATRRLTDDLFTRDTLDGVVRPLILHLHLDRLFDLPVEAKLRRLEDVLRYRTETEFCRAAGALGMSPHDLDSTSAARLRSFIDFTADEDARLDLASAISGEWIEPTLEWIKREIAARSATNSLPALPELHKTVRSLNLLNSRLPPYRLGYASARVVRDGWGIAEDSSVGGATGLARLCGGARTFTLSPPASGRVRGFQAHGEAEPVVVVRDEEPQSNLFLIARAIGDYVWFGSREAPIANLYTNRQALGRAFAAELLTPAVAVIKMVEEEGKSFDEVASHFGVTSAVVQLQYGNAQDAQRR